MTSEPKDYVAGVVAYRYPALGDDIPPGGAKVLLLTLGCICIPGNWTGNGDCLAWSPLPSRSEYSYPNVDGTELPESGNLLLLTTGDVCVIGPWTNDGRYLGWAKMPERNRIKEDQLLRIQRRAPRMAA